MTADSTRSMLGRAREAVARVGGRRHGVVVGIDRYRDDRLNLRYAANDARAMFELMTDPSCGMFAEADVVLLVDEAATKEAIWKALAALRRAGPDDDVWVFFAGHAAPEDDAVYWLAHDTEVDSLYVTGLGQPQIAEVLARIQAGRVLMMLDCCHAAATAARQNQTRSILTQQELFKQFEGKGRITFAASDGRQKSVEIAELGHGAFTYFLTRGMRGEADLDGDGVVTADELWRYLDGKVREASRAAGNAQTPVLIGQTTHQFAVSLNPRLSELRRQQRAFVEGLFGLAEDRLTTEEGRFLVELIEYGAPTDDERQLLADLDSVRSGQLRVPQLRRLIRAARQELRPRPEPPKELVPHAAPEVPRSRAQDVPSPASEELELAEPEERPTEPRLEDLLDTAATGAAEARPVGRRALWLGLVVALGVVAVTVVGAFALDRANPGGSPLANAADPPLGEDEAKLQANLVAQAAVLWPERGDKAKLEAVLAKYEEAYALDPNDRHVAGSLARGWYFLGDGHETEGPAKRTAFGSSHLWGTKCLAINGNFAPALANGEEASTVGVLSKDDVPCMYWTALALYQIARNSSVTMLKRLPTVKAYMTRVEELDASYHYGGPARFWGAYYANLPTTAGQDLPKSREYFVKAMRDQPSFLGHQVLLAETWATKEGNRTAFEDGLRWVLAQDPGVLAEVKPEMQAEQRKASALLATTTTRFAD